MALAAALLALAAVGAGPAEAKKQKATGGKIVFVSERTTGKAVDNTEGDDEIFVVDPKGCPDARIAGSSMRSSRCLAHGPVSSTTGE